MVLPPKRALDRRAVLQCFGAVSAGAAATAIVPATEAQAYNPGPTETRARYHETDHVKAFYRTNGYETLKK